MSLQHDAGSCRYCYVRYLLTSLIRAPGIDNIGGGISHPFVLATSSNLPRTESKSIQHIWFDILLTLLSVRLNSPCQSEITDQATACSSLLHHNIKTVRNKE